MNFAWIFGRLYRWLCLLRGIHVLATGPSLGKGIEMSKPVYLGDGLYAHYDDDMLRLFAHDGIRATNTVYLEPEVLEAFLRYVESIRRPANLQDKSVAP